MSLLENPIAEMSPFAFLALYALCIAGAFFVVRLFIGTADPTRGIPVQPVSTDRDPAEIAYLRGGANELLRFTIFGLVQRGLLRFDDGTEAGTKKKAKPTIGPASGGTGATSSNDFERSVLAYFSEPRGADAVFASPLPAAAAAYGRAQFGAKLEREGLLTGPAIRAAARRAGWTAAAALLALGIFRVAEALERGRHNVGFLVILMVIALIVMFVAARTGRLTARGREFMKRLHTALVPMRAAPVVAGVGTLPILVAATGLTALADTQYAQMNGMFRRQASSSGCGGGSCGSTGWSSGGDSGSSSCGGGSGCGGGCGGG